MPGEKNSELQEKILCDTSLLLSGGVQSMVPRSQAVRASSSKNRFPFCSSPSRSDGSTALYTVPPSSERFFEQNLPPGKEAEQNAEVLPYILFS